MGCLVCAVRLRVGTLCREHSLALATCEDITAEQVISKEPASEAEAWLIDQWGCTHAITSPAVIGRSAGDCNPSVLHPSVSVLHAQIEQLASGWRVVDRGSLNGTFVNGSRERAAALTSGDRVRFGDVSFFFSAGALPSVQDSGKTGGTQPSRVGDLSLGAVLELDRGAIELVQRVGGGIVRSGDRVLLELAQLEFNLLAVLVSARLGKPDPELAFVSARELADSLDFRSRDADSDNVRELVRRVRKKLGAAGIEDVIESRQRTGYRIGCPVSRPASR